VAASRACRSRTRRKEVTDGPERDDSRGGKWQKGIRSPRTVAQTEDRGQSLNCELEKTSGSGPG